MDIVFLTIDEVYRIHEALMRKDGGGAGVKDRGLIESALMNVEQTFGGQYLYANLPEMAGALWFGLVMNHGFIDGNKRVGLACASVFLRKNGHYLNLSQLEVERITLLIASSQLTRDEVIKIVTANVARL